MKKLFITLLVLSVSTVFYAQSMESPYFDNFEKGRSLVNVFLGNDIYFTSDINLKRTQGFEGQYEYCIKKGVSLGIFASYLRQNFEFDNKGEYESKYSDFSFGVIANYQLFHFIDRFIFYGGGKLGYKKSSVKFESSQNELAIEPDYSGILGGLQVGTRFFLSDRIAAHIEVGGYYTPAHSELGKLVAATRVGVSFGF